MLKYSKITVWFFFNCSAMISKQTFYITYLKLSFIWRCQNPFDSPCFATHDLAACPSFGRLWTTRRSWIFYCHTWFTSQVCKFIQIFIFPNFWVYCILYRNRCITSCSSLRPKPGFGRGKPKPRSNFGIIIRAETFFSKN